MGFTAETARRIYTSEMLLSDDFRDPHYGMFGWHEGWAVQALIQRKQELGLTSFDWGIGLCCHTLHIPLFDFSEVKSHWKKIPNNETLRFALTHPAKVRDAVA